MQNKKCLIISGGPLIKGGYLKNEAYSADFVICADGGVRYAKMLGVKPNLAVGDFDTLTELELQELAENDTEIIRYPCEKDYSDTHIAVLKALELGYLNIDLLAAIGGRIDHTLANIMLLALPEADKARIRIIEERQVIFRLKKREVLFGKVGETLSFFALGDEVTGIKSTGLQYQVHGGTLKLGMPIGLSNIFSDEKAVIEYEKGCLLVIRQNESK